MRQNYKCLLAALVLMSTTQTSSVVQAEGIRLVGPSGEVQASPSYAGEIERALPANTQPSRFFGPTGQNETLWSIASQLRPSRNVSVQQTLLAIYRINPQAFDNQNIHELIPGSRLRIPSLEQVQSATTAQAVAIMKAHEARSNQPKPPKPAPAKSIVEQPKPVAETTKPKVTSETVKPEMAKPKPVKSVELTPLVPTLTTSPEGEKQVSALKDKLQISQGELESLEEKNHRLRLMLSDVQNEVETLKTELNDEARIRTEVEKLLAEERKRLDEQQRMQPSTMDKILSNGWLVGLAALIPGALIALLVVTLLGRRAKSEEEQAAAQEPQSIDPLAAPLGLAAAEELEEELSLDDDLFGDDESANLFDQEEKPEEDDVFGNLDDDDLDFNLEGDDEEDPFASIGDDGDLDVGFYEFDSSNNGIKVNGEEKALGLEEMERALDEASPELEIADDEQVDFDLSDEESANDPFADLLAGDEPTEDLQSDSIDQALLDDLFADFGSDDLNLDVEDDKSSSAVSELGFSVGEATEDEIDKLLAQYDQPTTNSVEDLSKESDEATPDELDPLDELENIAGLSDDPSIEEDSTELLDELIGLDDEDASDDFDPLNELEKLSGFDGIEDLDEDSVDLLDELLDDNNTDEELDEDSKELDPFDDLIREDDEPTNSDSLSDDDLLASLGFGRLEPEVTEGIQSQPQSIVESSEKLDDEQVLGLESGLDIDALLSDNQPEREVESELQTEPLRQETDLEPAREEPVNTFEGNDTSDDLDSILNDEPQVSNEQDVPFEAETALDTQHELAEERTHSESGEDASELLNNYANALAQQSESEVDEAPVFTPTPDTVENEFGIPQEEDWLVDDIESETKLEQEPIAARSTETDIEDEESNFDALELPEFNEDDALASMADEPAQPESEKVAPEAVVTEAVEEEAFNLDDFDLPEFNEDDALASMADEPTLPESETAELSSSAEMAEDNAMSFDDLDLPEFDEEDALMSMTDNAEAHQPVLQSDNDHDALFEVFAQPGAFIADFESEKNEVETELNDFEEAAMANLLAENVDSQVFDGNLDSDTVASAGMDFETMLGVGDDWNGFKLSTECTSTTAEVPEDQREVWGSAAALAQPEIAPENWAEQDDLADFDPKKHQFMTIDELMAQVDKDGGEFEEQELKLDVGLNEFPDVIGDIGDVDVDSNAEAAGKLDLAKIYLEMNDPQGAVKLLEEAIVYGEDDIRREAKHLIDDIHGR